MSTIARRLQEAFNPVHAHDDPLERLAEDERDVQSLLRLAMASALSVGILALVAQLLP